MQESPARARGAVVVTSTDAQACSASPISVSPTQGTPTGPAIEIGGLDFDLGALLGLLLSQSAITNLNN